MVILKLRKAPVNTRVAAVGHLSRKYLFRRTGISEFTTMVQNRTALVRCVCYVERWVHRVSELLRASCLPNWRATASSRMHREYGV
jgi:hypothetical protein